MTTRTITIVAVHIEETDGPTIIDTDGAEVEELSRIVRLKPTLAKCGELVSLAAERKRRAR